MQEKKAEDKDDPTVMMASSQQRCVFVGNIPYDATEEQLIQICEEVGPVVSFRLVLDRETGKPKGYGFCEYKDEETALSARRNLQGYEINGRQLRVDFAENDKGADRNREQGRGGPGLASNSDAQKPSVGPAILGDSFLQQPIGLPSAATAASVMAGALGGVQTVSLNQNGLQVQSGMGNDPLTHYLANMSRARLYEIMSELKVITTQNKSLAHQLLVASPNLPKAIFQAQIMLGLVSPQLLQKPNIRQASSSHLPPSSQEVRHDPQPVLPMHHGQMPPLQDKMQVGLLPRLPEGLVSKVLQNAPSSQTSGLPLQNVRGQHFTAMPTLSGPLVVPSIRPQPLPSLSVPQQTPSLMTSNAVKLQMQTPLLQQQPVGATNMTLPQHTLPNGNLNVTLPRPLLSTAVQPGPSTLPANHGSNWLQRNNPQSNLPSGLAEKSVTTNSTSELMHAPTKLPITDGSNMSQSRMSANTSAVASAPSQVFGMNTLSTTEMASADKAQPSDNKIPQLPPEVESALLQQVMSLTSEQLSSLPPEQRQQVLQLQQMLR